VFYGFTVRLVGAPFFFARKKTCRSELAREKRHNNAVNPLALVIVDVHREQVRSYKDIMRYIVTASRR
jgi:hypothetical protein